ncbi:MAG: excinuclease ABC subunit C [Candidatus Aminicenantes bacterium RBG_16_66_30]|nr:MAG: excinuclease ABC subunit C [Candidatus Aminicenantes bacterium RBG_16_66_30]
MERLKARAAELPAKPGIYFFKSASGEVVYIGKARSLRDRVRSYLLPNPDVKVRNILRETADIDFILTGSEKEAAFLENNYVQQHQPRFNLRLKDDKSFPYLKLTVGETYPGVYFSRRVEPDGSRYFGPYSPAGRARSSIHLVNKHFLLRGCEEAVFRGRKRPCLEYELKLCSAPCVGLVSEADYRENVDNACLFLEGRLPELARTLKKRMGQAADSEKFEEAARVRDLLRTIEDYRDRPGTISTALEDQDVVGLAREGDRAAAYVFFMRKGKIRDSAARALDAPAGCPDTEVLADFLGGFYEDRETPPRLLLPTAPARLTGLQALLGWAKVRLIVPRGGKNLKLVDMAGRNAEAFLKRQAGGVKPLEELKKALGLPALPRTIEGFDISNTGGKESVGSLVVFRDGRPDKDSYRRFLVRTVEGSNDVASLAEVVTRRYRKALDEGAPLPDLVMVDGGKPQLGAAEKALTALGLPDLPLVSIAKKEEILFTPASRDGIRLDRTSPALRLVQAVRDETHRFAIALHRGRREKRSFESVLDGIPGLGPKKKVALLARYASLEAIRNAPLGELEKLVGTAVSARVLERLAAEVEA